MFKISGSGIKVGSGKLVPPFEGLNIHEIMIDLVEREARLSTCHEKNVGAAIIGLNLDSVRLLSLASNGLDGSLMDLNNTSYHKSHCIHAENRAIMQLPLLAKNYPKISYCNLGPCYDCATKLSKAKVLAHIYHHDYDDPSGVEYLLDQGIPVYRYFKGRIIPVHLDITLQKREVFEHLKKLNPR